MHAVVVDEKELEKEKLMHAAMHSGRTVINMSTNLAS